MCQIDVPHIIRFLGHLRLPPSWVNLNFGILKVKCMKFWKFGKSSIASLPRKKLVFCAVFLFFHTIFLSYLGIIILCSAYCNLSCYIHSLSILIIWGTMIIWGTNTCRIYIILYTYYSVSWVTIQYRGWKWANWYLFCQKWELFTHILPQQQINESSTSSI